MAAMSGMSKGRPNTDRLVPELGGEFQILQGDDSLRPAAG
jgi:hypothetical protein